MSRVRLLLAACFLTSISIGAIAGDEFSLIIDAMNQCYTGEVDLAFTKCVSNRLEKESNPNLYRAKIINDAPPHVKPASYKLIIYDKQGEMYTCDVFARKTLQIKGCSAEKIKPLSPAEERSIEIPTAPNTKP